MITYKIHLEQLTKTTNIQIDHSLQHCSHQIQSDQGSAFLAVDHATKTSSLNLESQQITVEIDHPP